MNKLDELKKSYQDIEPSEDFTNNIQKLIRHEKWKKIMKTSAVIAACILITFVTALNISPYVAYASSKVPYLNYIVKVVTFGKYEVKDKGFEAKVVIPEISGILDKDVEDKINAEFKENADSVINAFEKDMAELKAEFGEYNVHMGTEYNYIVKTDNDDFLALDVYVLNIVGSSSTFHKFYTIDKKSGKLLELKDVFKKDADYVTILSDYLFKEMTRLNQTGDGYFWVGENAISEEEAFKSIKENQNFYINDKGDLVICFDKYEVAAGVQGSPEFIIPEDIIKDIKNYI